MGRAVSPGFRLAATAVAFAVVSVCLVAFGVFALWLRSYDLAYIAAWQRAQPCSAAVGDCRATVNARLSGVHLDARPPQLDLSAGPTTYHAYFHRTQRAGLASLQTGDSVSVELWRGRVLAVGRVPTQDNPSQIDPSSTDIRYAIGLFLAGLTVGPFIAYLCLRERRRLQRLG